MNNIKELYNKIDNKIIELFGNNVITVDELHDLREALIELRMKAEYSIIYENNHIPRID